MFYINKKICLNCNLSGDRSPSETGIGKKYLPQAFVKISTGNLFSRKDEELFPDDKFSIAIPSCRDGT